MLFIKSKYMLIFLVIFTLFLVLGGPCADGWYLDTKLRYHPSRSLLDGWFQVPPAQVSPVGMGCAIAKLQTGCRQLESLQICLRNPFFTIFSLKFFLRWISKGSFDSKGSALSADPQNKKKEENVKKYKNEEPSTTHQTSHESTVLTSDSNSTWKLRPEAVSETYFRLIFDGFKANLRVGRWKNKINENGGGSIWDRISFFSKIVLNRLIPSPNDRAC